MFEPTQKCLNNAISKQNYTLNLFIAVKLTCSCRFSLRGNLDFLDFIKKGFITSNIGLTQVSNHSTGIEISGLRQSSGGKRTEVDFGAN